MKPLSRRKMLAALAVTGASAVGARRLLSAPAPGPASPPPAASLPVLSAPDRAQAAAKIMEYFARTAPQLLRPAQGLLSHPNIAPSLPGKQYSSTLWDWDTLWTTKGLFRFARLTNDPALRAKIVEHAQGSLLIFLENAGAEGRIPMLITVRNADPLDCLKPAPAPNHKNQAKPIFGQLALLAAD